MNVLRLDDSTRALLAHAGAPASQAPDAAATLGIRPEHIRLDPGGTIPATVENVEYFGADSIVIAALGTNRNVAIRAAGHLRADRGEKIMLHWSPTQQHFFDATGQALRLAPISS